MPHAMLFLPANPIIFSRAIRSVPKGIYLDVNDFARTLTVVMHDPAVTHDPAGIDGALFVVFGVSYEQTSSLSASLHIWQSH